MIKTTDFADAVPRFPEGSSQITQYYIQASFGFVDIIDTVAGQEYFRFIRSVRNG